MGTVPGVGERLRAFRREAGLTQARVASMLGVTQATISALESGKVRVSKNMESRLLAIVGSAEPEGSPALDVARTGWWDIASFVLGGTMSGDRVWLNGDAFAGRAVLMHCDAAGHDLAAKHMADNLVMGLEGVLGTMGDESSCVPEHICKSLDRMVKRTRSFWRGEPSCSVFVFNKAGGRVRFLNAGMPDLWLVRHGEGRATVLEEGRVNPMGNLPKGAAPFSPEVGLERGDALFLFSDGFLDEMGRRSTIVLEDHVVSIAQSLRGDAESVGTKILAVLDDVVLKSSRVEDNVSFVVVARNR